MLTPAGQLVLEEGRQILLRTHRFADKAREVATGWEPKISIGLGSAYHYPRFFQQLNQFLIKHPSIEVEVYECVLNGGWDLLAENTIDLAVGIPGPVPLQMGYRAVPLPANNMIPVLACDHPMVNALTDPAQIDSALPKLRRVINRDTTVSGVAGSAGLSDEGKRIYVQTFEQKLDAILAGIGGGHIPHYRAQEHLNSGRLVKMALLGSGKNESFLAWKISHKGKALSALTQLMAELH
ncbi:MAG: LysR family transcriptional regulator [Gammaproteobacteria bacterium]|nr:LysR family transcriptional regulator [Gammaproteobacteria bacterium]